MRILLIVDDPRIRLALQFLLSYQPEINLVGAVDRQSDPKPLIDATRPNVVVLDWDYPSPSGPEMLTAVLCAAQHIKTIVVSSDLEVESAAKAAGADAFVSKGDPPDQLLKTLRALHIKPNNMANPTTSSR
jgi:DNA-binding NarL/FixJ family response regulator